MLLANLPRCSADQLNKVRFADERFCERLILRCQITFAARVETTGADALRHEQHKERRYFLRHLGKIRGGCEMLVRATFSAFAESGCVCEKPFRTQVAGKSGERFLQLRQERVRQRRDHPLR